MKQRFIFLFTLHATFLRGDLRGVHEQMIELAQKYWICRKKKFMKLDLKLDNSITMPKKANGWNAVLYKIWNYFLPSLSAFKTRLWSHLVLIQQQAYKLKLAKYLRFFSHLSAFSVWPKFLVKSESCSWATELIPESLENGVLGFISTKPWCSS